MAFESGSVSFRMYNLPRSVPEDALERFQENAMPTWDHLVDGKLAGWVSGRHLLDRRIDEETSIYAGYYRLALLQAEKKVPASLLKAEIQQEELARKAARNLEFLARKERSEIKQEVIMRLLPQMPPTLKAMPFVFAPESTKMYATALSDTASDELVIHWRHALDFAPEPQSPETVAMNRKSVDPRDWYAASFSPEVDDDLVDHVPGRDFLTWLWFVSEARGGEVDLPGVGRVAVMIQGPITLSMEGAGAHETRISKGNPVLSAEARTALLAGKKVSKAKFFIGRADEVWEATIGDDFVFRSVKLPESEDVLDNVSRFSERLSAIDDFTEMFFGLYDDFVDRRRDKDKWSAERGEIREWVKGRKGVR